MILKSKVSQRQAHPKKFFRLSLRYKLTLPVFLMVSTMTVLLSYTTYEVVRAMVVEKNQSRLLAIAEVFKESLKVPLMLNNQQVLIANIEWMSRRPDVMEVRVEDSEGVIVGGTGSVELSLPEYMNSKKFVGIDRIAPDTYAAVVPIEIENRVLGRLIIFFSHLGVEKELARIFQEKLLLGFALLIGLAFLTSGLTWLAIRPLFKLQNTVRKIRSGDLTARANIHTFDEFEDLGDAVNEMVARLSHSLNTLRARTEQLEESEEKYRLIIDTANDIIFSLDEHQSIVLLNKGFSGCSLEQILEGGMSFFENLFTDDSRSKFKEAVETVTTKKTPVTNLALTQKHYHIQSEIFYLLNLTPVADHDGKVKTVQGMMKDVTELRRIEMMKDSLIRDVAHELKTPTAKFQMGLEWFERDLKHNPDHSKYQSLIDMMKLNTDRLVKTITSILDLTKLEAGMDRVDKKDFDLRLLLEQVYSDMKDLCSKRGLSLILLPCPETAWVHGDRDMLYRVFVNLIGNSIKFTPEGQITLHCRKSNDKVLIDVQDTGIGIEQEDLEKIFERFYQKTAASTGIGVGLTISRDIVLLHQGKIHAFSEGAGKGTVFTVELPLLETVEIN